MLTPGMTGKTCRVARPSDFIGHKIQRRLGLHLGLQKAGGFCKASQTCSKHHDMNQHHYIIDAIRM